MIAGVQAIKASKSRAFKVFAYKHRLVDKAEKGLYGRFQSVFRASERLRLSGRQ